MRLFAIGEGAIGELPDAPPILIAETGSFSLSGQDAGLTYYVPNRHRLAAIGEVAIGELPDTEAAALSFNAEVGTFTLTGQTAGLAVGHKVAAGTGTFTLTGQSAGLPVLMPAQTGVFTITGTADLRSGRFLYATPYARNDQYAHILFSAIGQVPVGGSDTDEKENYTTFALTGGPSTELRINWGLSLGGVFTLTGQDVDFTRSRKRIRGFPRVGAGISATARVGSGIVGRPRVGSGIRGRAA